MEEKTLKISNELLDNLSLDDIAELKVEIDDMVNELDDIIETCNEVLNS